MLQISKKIIIKYPISNENWNIDNVYYFTFEYDKCSQIIHLEFNFEEISTDLRMFDGLEIFGTFRGYTFDKKSIWILDLLQLNRDLTLNKIL